jgi:translocation and assembly module TamB
MRRRLPQLLLGLLVIAIGALLTLPWWLGAAVRTFGSPRGVAFARYERIGYTRFALHDVEVKVRGVRVTATRAEADTPILWAWRHWRGASAPIVAGDWQVEVAPPTAPRDPNAPRGWLPLRSRLQRIAAGLERWLPRASTGAGVVRWPGGDVAIGAARWSGSELQADAVRFRGVTADVTAAFPDDDRIVVAARLPDSGPRAQLESRGDRVSGELTWLEQRATLTATYVTGGWLPAEASLQARTWQFPGDRLKVGALYGTVRGDAQIEWSAGRFVTAITAKGEPLPDKAAPPLELTVRGQGDPARVTIEAFKATLPGITAELTEPVVVESGGRIQESMARFRLAADLGAIPWFKAQGSVTGEASLVSGLAASPVADFFLNAQDIQVREVKVAGAALRGRLDWPRLQLTEGTVSLAEGERLAATGSWDFRAREVRDVKARSAGARLRAGYPRSRSSTSSR